MRKAVLVSLILVLVIACSAELAIAYLDPHIIEWEFYGPACYAESLGDAMTWILVNMQYVLSLVG